MKLSVVLMILLCVSCVTAASHSFKNSSNDITFCVEKERQALLSFRSGLRLRINDAHHPASSTFLSRRSNSFSLWTAKNCCKWRGVECSIRTGRVVKLELGSSNLAGRSNLKSLLELQELKFLDLKFVSFQYVPFPKLFGSMSKLEYLDLSNCDFTGMIPSQLGNLSNLNYLALGNSLDNPRLWVENVDWLSRLSSLETLSLVNIDLSRASNWVDKVRSLPFLSDLTFSNCSLSKVSSPFSKNFSSSTSIKTLVLDSNGFTSSMYSWLFNLSSTLVHLGLTGNNVNAPIFESFGDYMPFLEFLDFSSNHLNGMIPNSFENMPFLEDLYLFDNVLQGMMPNSVRNMSSLKYLDMGNNNLSGYFSDFVDILSAPTLEVLVVDNNKLYGPLPDGIIKFSSLASLFVSFNQLNGTLSKNLGKLSSLVNLDLSSNSLTGTLSETHFSNLSSLSNLDLSANRIQIHVSPQWVPCFQLDTLWLNSCNLGPHFPNWIRSQKNLATLDLSNNGISDNIPPWFWNLCSSNFRMKSLNLSSNNIGGTLPDLSTLKTLSLLDLSLNNFEGPIPSLNSHLGSINLSENKFSGTLSFLCLFSGSSLTYLDISKNFVSGRLPDCWANLTTLIVINLAHNGLFGVIPSSLGSLYLLETLNLYNNSFSSELPFSLSSCKKLSFLDVGENKLTSNVPSWIGENLMQLLSLSLRSNNFSGTIPLELCWLHKLRILDLSRNNLRGSIPSCIKNFTSMVQGGLVEFYAHYYGKKNIWGYMETNGIYDDKSVIGWQGRQLEFGKNLRLLKLIDLSSNKLTGEIPNEITELFELAVLNLSRNALQGNVPRHIGQLKSILSLDLSQNRLSGKIPASLSQLSSLNDLDMSYNEFSGEIPSSTQLQSFDASKFTGNVGLCGPPLTPKCPGDESPTSVVGSEDNEGDNEEDEFTKWLYIGLASGFVSGFWGICGSLFLYRRSRHAFFLFIDELTDWFYVKIAVAARRF